ncbi:MAG TPA: hypothetical protein PLR99_28705, partial [Polyangiaceae bacterium]|nr:hypothetical protein [Polyangiaceae bacterium]
RLTTAAPDADDGLDELDPPRASARQGRTSLVTIVIVCFAMGVLLSIGVAYKLGRIGPDRALEAELARAQAALLAHRLYEPPGDNVREITALALQRWPREPRLLEVRGRACDELVTLARVERNAPESLRVAKIAADLDPTDPSAKRLVEELESELAKLVPPEPTTAPLASGKPSPLGPGPGPGAPPAPGHPAPQTSLDVTPAAPRVGQTVAFLARVPAKGKILDPAFTVSGATLAPARMPALPAGPGVYRGGFAFLQPGAYQVVFTATVDGAPARVERTITAQALGAPAPSAPPTADPPDPPTPTAPTAPTAAPSSSSARWL